MLAAASVEFLAEAMVLLMPESLRKPRSSLMDNFHLQRKKDKAFLTSGRMIISLGGSGQHESLSASMFLLPLLYFMTKS